MPSTACPASRHIFLDVRVRSHTDCRTSSEYEVALVEEHELTAGPLSLLQTATRTHTQVLISCRNNRKYVSLIAIIDLYSIF